ncbi:hypothetical protein KGF57_002081 [Candida theae]|uniref:protein-tyrosine-phosphatase n=1 Tax=Candida theae TaxID=1198502 RepID=A0AAD5FZ28_9ASCO|nr:uncharacterized protein KGF57_002081 [Candida theae]KAI5959443.1 hypothetical protein KGF57_002081 [Candida theae]
MATTASVSSPNGFNHTNNTNNSGVHGTENGSSHCIRASSSQSPLATPTATPPPHPSTNPQSPQSQQSNNHGLQRQLSQSQSQLQSSSQNSTPKFSHTKSPMTLPSLPRASPQLNENSNTKENASTPRTLYIQPQQSNSLPLNNNQFTPGTSFNNNNKSNHIYLQPNSPHRSSPVSNTISTPRSGSLSGPSTPSFKLNSPSPTTSTFATSFPPTISEQSAANLTLQDYDFIFDVRPFNLFCKSRITKATNLCLPTTLLKRNSKSLTDLINMVDLSSEMKDIFIQHLQTEDVHESRKLSILIYDQCSSHEAITFPLYQTISKFEKYHEKFNIYYLNGGFAGVLTQNNGVVDIGPLRSDGESGAASNGHRKTKSLSGFTLPSATNFKTKFVQSIKKNNDYDVKKGSDPNKEFFSDLSSNGSANFTSGDNNSRADPSYKYKLRDIPSDLALPKWLQFMRQGSNEESVQYMISKFEKVEEIEKSRLNKMASNFKSPHTSNIQGQDKIFSPCCPDCSTIDFQLPQGIEFGYKNRFNNVWPYEHSRVKLGQVKKEPETVDEKDKIGQNGVEKQNFDDNQYSQYHPHHPHHHHDHHHHHHRPIPQDDYFNGNYINTSKLISNNLTYIATQNPLSSTIDDFWSTIELEDVQVIINLEAKPIEYFNHPSIKSIEVVDTPYPDFKLRLINNRIYHFHYLSWPDFGVPHSFQSILNMIKYKNQLTLGKQLNNKLLVHCTAGCGRTGVFITLDSLIQAWKNSRTKVMDSDIDLVYKLVQHQRRQRVGMVQNLDQFIIIYEIFIEYLINNQ